LYLIYVEKIFGFTFSKKCDYNCLCIYYIHSHSKVHHLVRDRPEGLLLAACLRIPEALHLDQTGTDHLGQVNGGILNRV
jgi:hypothetical protein